MGDHERNTVPRRTEPPPPRARARASSSGFTLIESVVALAILVVALLAVAGSASGNLVAVRNAKLTNRATHFVEETLDSVSEQSFDDVLILDGDVLYDNANPTAARYRIVLSASEAAVDLLTIKVALFDNRTQALIGRFVTLRSRR